MAYKGNKMVPDQTCKVGSYSRYSVNSEELCLFKAHLISVHYLIANQSGATWLWHLMMLLDNVKTTDKKQQKHQQPQCEAYDTVDDV